MISAVTTPITWAQAGELSQISSPIKKMIKRHLQLAAIDSKYLAGATILALFLGLYCTSNGGHNQRGGEVVVGVALLMLGGVLGYATYLGDRVRAEMQPYPKEGRPILAKLIGISLPLDHTAKDRESYDAEQDPHTRIDELGRCTPYHRY